MAKDAKTNKAGKVGFFKRTGRFFKELKGEFKKIVWPTKKQVLNNTVVVLIFSGITALGVWLVTLGFASLFGLII